jgi:hypothetical protein
MEMYVKSFRNACLGKNSHAKVLKYKIKVLLIPIEYVPLINWKKSLDGQEKSLWQIISIINVGVDNFGSSLQFK